MTARGPYLLAVDAGTGSCRALLFTAAGEQVAVSFREWTHREPPGVPGGQMNRIFCCRYRPGGVDLKEIVESPLCLA